MSYLCMKLKACSALILLIVLISPSHVFSAGRMPENLIIEEIFQPGYGTPIGRLDVVDGEVILVHEDLKKGYRAEKDLPLFQNDLLVTREKGRARLELLDGSLITVAPQTELQFSRAVFDPDKKTRSSFLTMGLGKARFIVSKLMGFKQAEFNVRTPTAVAGVRGSDLMIRVFEMTEQTTRPYQEPLANAPQTGPKIIVTDVLTGEKTTLQVIPLAKPEEPITLRDNQMTSVLQGEPALPPKDVDPDEIKKFQLDFKVSTDTTTGSPVPSGEEKKGKSDGSGKGEEKADQASEPADKDTSEKDSKEGDKDKTGEKKEDKASEKADKGKEKSEVSSEEGEKDKGGAKADEASWKASEKTSDTDNADLKKTVGEDTSTKPEKGSEAGEPKKSDPIVTQVPITTAEPQVIYVPPETLTLPSALLPTSTPLPTSTGAPFVPEIIRQQETLTQQMGAQEMQTKISEQQKEQQIEQKKALPPLPGRPQ